MLSADGERQLAAFGCLVVLQWAPVQHTCIAKQGIFEGGRELREGQGPW